MTLQSSGQISASDINVELRRAWNAPFNINGVDERKLANKTTPGSPISFSDFYGKSYGAVVSMFAADYTFQNDNDTSIQHIYGYGATTVDTTFPGTASLIGQSNTPSITGTVNGSSFEKFIHRQDGQLTIQFNNNQQNWETVIIKGVEHARTSFTHSLVGGTRSRFVKSAAVNYGGNETVSILFTGTP